MRISKTLISGAVAAVAVAGSANAGAIVVDNFSAGPFSTQNVLPSGGPAWTAQTNASIFALPGSNNYRARSDLHHSDRGSACHGLRVLRIRGERIGHGVAHGQLGDHRRDHLLGGSCLRQAEQ